MDKEYSVCYKGPSGLTEIALPVNTLVEAKRIVKEWLKDGEREVTIKYYEEGDLKHQWDLTGKAWVQYE